MSAAPPQTEKELQQKLNGVPRYLGQLVSSGPTVVVNNRTTANPFNFTPKAVANALSPNVGLQPDLEGTLAGKVLLLQPTGAGVFLPSMSTVILGVANAAQWPELRVEQQTGTISPGVQLLVGPPSLITMPSNFGWLQWSAVSAAATLLVWEMVR